MITMPYHATPKLCYLLAAILSVHFLPAAKSPVPDALRHLPQAGPDSPNILFLLAEDIGPELSCYPENWAAPLVRTPNIDRLAREGTRYTRCFTTAPVCSASRSALMTGMYQTAIGAHNHRTSAEFKKALPEGVFTITDYFRAAGYFTVNVTEGKKKDKDGNRLPTGAGGSGKTDLNFITDNLYDGRDWNERDPGQPFFAQLTIQESHKGIGWTLCREDKQRVPQTVDPDKIPVPPYYPDHPVVRDEMANYLDAIMLMDSYVGDVLERLDKENLLASTIIVFMGDNGRCLSRGKQFLYDGGIHVPLIIRWPDGSHSGRVDDALIEGIDVSAALLGMAGIQPLPKMQGRDFLNPQVASRQHVFAARDRCDLCTDRMRCVRTQRWKYIRNYLPAIPYMQYNSYKIKEYPTWSLLLDMHEQGTLSPEQDRFALDRKPIEELYDLEMDPHEVNNLAHDPDHFEVLRQLRGLVDDWVSETNDAGAVMEDPIDIYKAYAGQPPEEGRL